MDLKHESLEKTIYWTFEKGQSSLNLQWEYNYGYQRQPQLGLSQWNVCSTFTFILKFGSHVIFAGKCSNFSLLILKIINGLKETLGLSKESTCCFLAEFLIQNMFCDDNLSEI